MYKRIDYVAGGEQHGYRTGKADNQRGTDNVLHTLYEVTAGFVGIHLEKNNGQYYNGEIQRGYFRHTPAPVERTYNG